MRKDGSGKQPERMFSHLISIAFQHKICNKVNVLRETFTLFFLDHLYVRSFCTVMLLLFTMILKIHFHLIFFSCALSYIKQISECVFIRQFVILWVERRIMLCCLNMYMLVYIDILFTY